MEAETDGPPASLWGFRTCFLMLLGVITLMLISGYVTARIWVARTTSETPPTLVKTSYSEEERVKADNRLDSLNKGKEEIFTPRELTVLVQRYLDKVIPNIGAVFICETTPDGGVSWHLPPPARRCSESRLLEGRARSWRPCPRRSEVMPRLTSSPAAVSLQDR